MGPQDLALWGFAATAMLYTRRRFGFSAEQMAGLVTMFGLVKIAATTLGLRRLQRHCRRWKGPAVHPCEDIAPQSASLHHPKAQSGRFYAPRSAA